MRGDAYARDKCLVGNLRTVYVADFGEPVRGVSVPGMLTANDDEATDDGSGVGGLPRILLLSNSAAFMHIVGPDEEEPVPVGELRDVVLRMRDCAMAITELRWSHE